MALISKKYWPKFKFLTNESKLWHWTNVLYQVPVKPAGCVQPDGHEHVGRHLHVLHLHLVPWVCRHELPGQVTFFVRYYSLQRTNNENSKQIFPEKELHGHSPNFHIRVSVNDLYIPTIDLPFLLQEICGPILGIGKSLTDTWNMWKLGLRPRNSPKRNT